MAISTPTNVAAVTGGSTANASSYDTAATILTAGRLYRLTVVTYKSSTPAIPTTVTHNPTGTSLSFALVTAGGQDASVVSFDSAAHRSLSVWEVVPGSTTASALIRITGMGSCSSCGWSLTEITSGFNSAAPTAQVKVASGLQTSAIAVTMGSFADSANLTTLVMGWGDGTANPAETIVATEGRTELEEHNDGERSSLGSDYQNPNGGDTTIGATLSASTVDWACIGIETAVLAAVTSTATLTVVPTVAATATVINPVTSTAALTVVPSVTAAGSESLTSTAALTVVPSVTAAAQENLTGTAALTVVPSVTAAAAESLTATAALTVVPTVEAAATVSGGGPAPVTATADLTIVPSVAASAAESLTATAALTVVPAVTAAAAESLTSTAALTVVPSVAAAASENLTATAALTVVPVVAATTSVTGGPPADVTATAALMVVPSVSGVASESLSASAALSIVPVVVGTATATGGPVNVTATVAMVIPLSVVARGRRRLYADPSIADFIRWHQLGGGRDD